MHIVEGALLTFRNEAAVIQVEWGVTNKKSLLGIDLVAHHIQGDNMKEAIDCMRSIHHPDDLNRALCYCVNYLLRSNLKDRDSKWHPL